jgi:hypothetical protein
MVGETRKFHAESCGGRLRAGGFFWLPSEKILFPLGGAVRGRYPRAGFLTLAGGLAQKSSHISFSLVSDSVAYNSSL